MELFDSEEGFLSIMTKELTVYLDHHIHRDNLLYGHSNATISQATPKDLPAKLQIRDLYSDESVCDLLRKPDFQRTTAAWTPKDCVSLLECILTERVIPSVIMWRSPQKLWYVLDGGHRISVVLAWLRNDWGDKFSADLYMDEELEEQYKKAAKEVHKLLEERGIKKFAEYRSAYNKYVLNYGENHDTGDAFFSVDSETEKLINIYRSIKGTMGFPLQWVEGDYDKAEESFLNINKSGRKLTDWEKRLVENRNSSLARTVMSIAHTPSAEYCWPSGQRGLKSAREVLDLTTQLHKMLFEPIYDSSFRRLQQPLLVESKTEPDKKPAYIAEFLTVIRGYKGQDAQTEKLLKLDRSASEVELVRNGLTLLQDSIGVCSHLIGTSAQPQSLSLIPALYFYSDNGKNIRSLLYGFIYWLFYGNNEDITFTRKLLFSAYRAAFERVFLEKKKIVVSTFSRKIGSGSEVTGQMAGYYNTLLELLVKHQGNNETDGFKQEYETLVKRKEDIARPSSGKSRTFTSTQKSAITLRTWIDRLPRCAICGGLLDPVVGIQFDHTLEHSKGGLTHIENGRPTHPFCNNNRWTIERIQRGEESLKLPLFGDSATTIKIKQLSFLTDIDYEDYDSPLSSILGSE